MSLLHIVKCDFCGRMSQPCHQHEIPNIAFQVITRVPEGMEPRGLLFCSPECVASYFSDPDATSTDVPTKKRLGFDLSPVVAVNRPEGFQDDPDEVSRRVVGDV